MLEMNALWLAGAQEADHICIDERHFSKVQRYGGRARDDLSFQLIKTLGPNSTNQLDGGAVLARNLLNLQGHACW